MAQVQKALWCSATGSAATVRHRLGKLTTTLQPDELMLTVMIHDHSARLRSFEIVAEVLVAFREDVVAARVRELPNAEA